ncbi:Maf family protein [Reinekea blandensis]|uniref:7-methyl-GTP pyrophosphatase n=1 Tax=Reinekea blandensis MED297 TaxID=314283 RepID=A4BE00_9GAMM|nr:Maf family protein [Reinekea blandensis]EAR09759.1 maf protein [Reinekea blandensis MED297]
MFPIILASQSPYKQKQLSDLGLNFKSIAPSVAENHALDPDPEKLAIALAQQKSDNVYQLHPDAIVIGSDQTAIGPDGALLIKPGNRENAIRQLQLCSGKTVTFYSGVSLNSADYKTSTCVATVVAFRHLSLQEIERYVDADRPYDCAGSFKVESLGITLFESVRSDDPSALIGLPMIELCRILRECGIALP